MTDLCWITMFVKQYLQCLTALWYLIKIYIRGLRTVRWFISIYDAKFQPRIK